MSCTLEKVVNDWRITEDEFNELDQRFGKLAHKAAWQLYSKNSRISHTDEQEDIAQDLKIALMRAGSYYKRQVYIESCLKLCQFHAQDKFLRGLIIALVDLWKNKTRHGAGRQKFGLYQETLLNKILKKTVPKKLRPKKDAPLRFDIKFATYCKSIMWNQQKAMGKKITREKAIRAGQVSISEFDYIGSN